jgi:hypothetical protein
MEIVMAKVGRPPCTSKLLKDGLKDLRPGTPEYIQQIKFILAAERNENTSRRFRLKERQHRETKKPRKSKGGGVPIDPALQKLVGN